MQGKAAGKVADEIFEVAQGEALQVDCQISHSIKNAGEGNMRYALIIAK